MGGSARDWTTDLDEAHVPGGGFSIRLVMTKHDLPAVQIAWQILLVPA